MNPFNTKLSRNRHGRRLSPHCRGGASSMLRLSSSPASGFGGFDQRTSAMQRLAGVPLLPQALAAGGAASVASTRPLYTRLWPSASFGGQALWQDTLVALD